MNQSSQINFDRYLLDWWFNLPVIIPPSHFKFKSIPNPYVAILIIPPGILPESTRIHRNGLESTGMDMNYNN